MMTRALVETSIPGRPPDARGKVRDIYDLGDKLLVVATDRISAFDWINPTGIPGKGKILTQLTVWWMNQMTDLAPNHLISSQLDAFPPEFQAHPALFQDRSMLVRKCAMFPIEFVIRGYLAGSGWKEYQATGTVCGIRLPEGLQEGSRLPEPIYTPATKSAEGHDINISPQEAGDVIGHDWNEKAAGVAHAIYARAHAVAADRGLILADTKFEFGLYEGGLMLADEILTPDSSRYWPADGYAAGQSQPSFDKQFVRDYLESTGWDKQSLPPALPEEVVEKTQQKYLEALTRLTGKESV